MHVVKTTQGKDNDTEQTAKETVADGSWDLSLSLWLLELSMFIGL